MDRGYVVLVGAGPTKDLLTLRGKQEIEKADVIVYDDLIDASILNFAKECAEKIYVGKRYHHHSRRQDEINSILIQKAKENKAVVRLKGGDSFVFGRGGEEILALQSENIPTHVIPGISTCIAVPEDFGIPVTHRSVSKSFTVVTGHNTDEISENYEALAKIKGTLVFLMSLHTIPQICEDLIRHGKDRQTPCAILSKGFHEDKLRVNGTLEDIVTKLDNIPSPALFVVGNTSSFELQEQRASVNVVGSKEFCDKFKTLASHYGLCIHSICDIETVPLFENVPHAFHSYSHIAFTSAKGVSLFFEYMQKNEIDLRQLGHIQFACVGQQCANELKKIGFIADLIPKEYTGKALANALVNEQAKNVLILRSQKGSQEFVNILQNAHIAYTDAHIYTMKKVDIQNVPSADYTIFASGDAVRYYFESHDLKGSIPVCIGKVTEQVLGKYTDQKIMIANKQSIEEIIEKVWKDIEKK